LSVWREAQFVHHNFPTIPADKVWKMISDGPRSFLSECGFQSGLEAGSQVRFAKFKLPTDRVVESGNVFEVLLESDQEPELVTKTLVD
jgi:hypothetical protein